jgi:hypothetical protein
VVAISGPNAADFAVTVAPATSVAAGGGANFQVRFSPSGSGVRSATISIANSSAIRNPYTFAVQGTGVEAPAPPRRVRIIQ